MNEDQIRKLFAQHDVALGRDDVWRVQGTPVIKHSALERLAAALRLTWHPPVLIRSERDECVVLVTATRADGITEWSFGEALINQDGQAGGNYKVSGKQASYVYAMGEKRGKDRVIIKLAGLHGAYSEEEADDFRDRSKRDSADDRARDEIPSERPRQNEDAVVSADPVAPSGEDNRTPEEKANDAIAALAKFSDATLVTQFMTNKGIKAKIKALGPDLESKVTAFARQRHAELKAQPAA